ncbi:MAG: YndJ family transporter [Planctomycetales bacterium]|nr:YndJ family transporter [Planctomycetales bacterium]
MDPIDAFLFVVPVVVWLCWPFLVRGSDRVAAKGDSISSSPPVVVLAAAAGLMGASVVPRGPWAVAMASPWFVVTLWLGVRGLAFFWHSVFAPKDDSKPIVTPSEVCIHIGMVFVAVGGFWAVVAKNGTEAFGYSYDIVRLTGVHFHFAGLGLPVIAANVVKRLPRRIGWTISAAVLLGIPLVGVGIVASPTIEIVGVILLTLGCVSVAGYQIWLAARANEPATLIYLCVSSLALFVGMTLAMIYAWGEFTNHQRLPIPTMAATHGLANGLGFTLCGLLGWRRVANVDSRARAGQAPARILCR